MSFTIFQAHLGASYPQHACFLLGVIHKIFQAHLGASYPQHAKAKLAGEVVRKFYLRPHAAHCYRVKLGECGALWGERERVVWSIGVAQVIKYPFQSPSSQSAQCLHTQVNEFII